MEIRISGQHFTINSALKEHIEHKLQELAHKYFEKAVSSVVHLAKESHLIACDINFHEGSGKHFTINSNASCDDAQSAFDQATAKLERQLRKYKSKLKDHHFAKASQHYIDGTEYILNSQNTENEVTQDDHFTPVTIAERGEKIGTYSVADAIMRMELENVPALVFKNVTNDRINVVYQRKDRNISWVDPVE